MYEFGAIFGIMGLGEAQKIKGCGVLPTKSVLAGNQINMIPNY